MERHVRGGTPARDRDPREGLGRVSVTDLAGRYGVTPETIRRDLDALAVRGLLSRVHGGPCLSTSCGWRRRRCGSAR
ncbi:DeoR family transcriptional regulator [Tessaracoccus coleopterorum]|uniref:DeoR family transcriptional regulator n=1 Tax=Tessaracoccus coleopterorum TaxID=2714950 RepID=UPI001E56CD05|nr:DeoR family transcriptional regulator [Tessaracoccus coleopterorum]